MARKWAALLGLFVAIAVFLALGLPMLRDLFGPAATLAAYGYIAFVAGTLTYAVVRWLSTWRTGATPTRDADPSPNGDGPADGRDPVVDAEMDQLRDEAE